jgi:ATP-binding cassette subfamily B protein
MKVLEFCKKVFPPFKLLILGCMFSVVIYATIGSLRPYLTKQLVNIANSSGSENIWSIGVWLIALYIIIPLNWRFYDWCLLNYEPSLKNSIARTCFNHVLKQDYRYFQENFAGGISAKINDITSMVPSMLQTAIFGYFGNFLSVAIAICVLSSVHLWFGLGMLTWLVFIVTISVVTIASLNSMTKDVAEKASIIVGHVVDVISNILNIKLFSTRAQEAQHLHTYQSDYLKAARKRRMSLFKFYGVQGMSFAMYQCFCFYLLVSLFKEGRVTAGDFVLILMINGWIIDSIWQMSDQLRTFSENWGAVQQGLGTIYRDLKVQDIDGAKDLKVIKGEIEFDNVRFDYVGEKSIFLNKSIKLNPGEKVGLVGYSGSGKSTFVNIILRLFDVSDGVVRIDGQNIAHVTQDSLRKSIAMIPQDPTLFHRSLISNIRYGNDNATKEQIIAAAKKAHANDFIGSLAEGYESLVGERGIKLSGGQRQRIAIARAILKNAPILILDEATSQLDSITENFIQESLWELMQGKTTIVVAHRLSTLLHMDRILVFDNGKIIEDGTHHELMKRNGHYKILWDAQVGGFLPSFDNK